LGESLLVNLKSITRINIPTFKGMSDVIFISLVVLDGWLTRVALELGHFEGNPNPLVLWGVHNLWTRLLIAVIIVLLLRRFGKAWLIRVLCYVLLGVCLWSTVVIKWLS